jgi:hypothetical protein
MSKQVSASLFVSALGLLHVESNGIAGVGSPTINIGIQPTKSIRFPTHLRIVGLPAPYSGLFKIGSAHVMVNDCTGDQTNEKREENKYKNN